MLEYSGQDVRKCYKSGLQGLTAISQLQIVNGRKFAGTMKMIH